MRNRNLWLAVSCAMLVVAIMWIPSWDRDPAGSAAATPGTGNRGKLTAIRSYTGKYVSGRRVSIKPASPADEKRELDPYESWPTEKILANFGILAGRFTGESVPEAIEFLRRAYEENGGENVEFRVEGGGGYPLKFEYGNISAKGLMELVAGLGGYSLEIGDREVAFRRRPMGSPGFQEMRLESTPFESLFSRPDDPFGETEEELAISPAAVVDILAGFGIELEQGHLSRDPSTGQLLFSGSADLNDRLLALYRHLSDPPDLGQIHISGKSISLSDGDPIGDQSLRDEEYQTTILELSQRRGASVLSLPSLTVPIGQSAKSEVLSEVMYPGEGGEVGEFPRIETASVGHSVEIRASVVGLDRIALEGHVDLFTTADQSLGDLVEGRMVFGEGLRWTQDDFRTMETAFEGLLLDGDTAGFVSAEEGSESIQQFLSVRRMDSDGLPLLGE